MPDTTELRVGIVGAGLMGWRRAPVLQQFPNTKIKIIAAAHQQSAEKLAAAVGCTATDRWQDVISRDDVNVVLVATPPHLHPEISIAAMKAGKHVLCEKPLARFTSEAEEMVSVAKATGVTFKCGFNHRHHPAVLKAKAALDNGSLGELNFMRARYGILGRPGYEKEWRANPAYTGGGQLMEQGIHAVDLFRWFAGDFNEASGFVATRYWKIKPLEDNAFAIFRNQQGQMASLHSSLTQWKNIFSLEIFGQNGYAVIEGLGGGYGTETISLGMRDFNKPFSDEVIEYRGGDSSWKEEWHEFINAVQEKREPLGSGADGIAAIKYVHAVYESSQTGRVVPLR